MSVTFLIRHKSSGKFIYPRLWKFPQPEMINFDSVSNANMQWKFIHIEGVYGYIQHVASGKIVQPIDSIDHINPAKNDLLTVYNNQNSACLFVLDEVRHWIMHKGGLKAHPKGGHPTPDNDTNILLHPDVHDAMTWLFVHPDNPSKEISIYGKPTVTAEWTIVRAIINPIATHEEDVVITQGKSKTKSTSHDFQFKWEISTEAKELFLSFDTSESFQRDVKRSSSDSWSEETTVTRKIQGLFFFHVKPI